MDRNFIKTFKAFISILCIFVLPIAAISASDTHEYNVVRDVEWAKPGGHSLTMDIYTPGTGRSSYPVIVIYHGGAWLINNKSVMDSMATYIASHSEYVVCNVNYRLLADNSNTITMNQIIEDALGAVMWIKENIALYKGDSTKIIVAGDSAGGHLAAMVVLSGNKLESDGFAGDSRGFNPTWMPEGITAEDIAKRNGLEVQAAILNYPGINMYSTCLDSFEIKNNFFWTIAQASPRGIFGDTINVMDNADYYKDVSPVYIIPESSERVLPPQLCIVGSRDDLIIPSSIKQYVAMLKEKGQKAEYWEHKDRPHAFLDSWKNEYLGTEFRKDAPPALDRMIVFLDSLFYKNQDVMQ
jgi:acetyl esterase